MEFKILKSIGDYVKKTPVRLHMPGHKANEEFCKLFSDARLDITELKSANNEQAVLDAEKDVALILGAKKSKLLSDGASMAIFAMVYAVKHLGSKIIIERTAHKSVYNALINFGIEPIILGDINENGLHETVSVNEIEKAIDENPDVIGALLTYPDYYGRTFDIDGVSKLLNKRNKKLLIDNAHGGHYAFIDGYTYAGRFADVWVDSVHKVLSTLNQGAILSVNDRSLIDGVFEGASIFSTSSPSYGILASVEYGVKKADSERKEYAEFCKKIELFKRELTSLGYSVMPNTDCFKLVVEFGKNVNMAERFFEENGIFAEMNDGKRLLFMFSLSNGENDLRKLKRAFERLNLSNEEYETAVYRRGEKVENYLKALSCPFEYVEIDNAIGRVSAVNAGLFPPCYPLVVAGERITKETVKLLTESAGVFGVNDGKIKVIKEENER